MKGQWRVSEKSTPLATISSQCSTTNKEYQETYAKSSLCRTAVRFLFPVNPFVCR